SMDQGAASASKLRVDEALAQQYADALQHLAQKLHISPTLSLTEMTRWPGVFSIEQTSWTPELALPHLEKAVDVALTQMLAMRQAEGLNLKTDISTRLDALQVMLRDARALSPQIIERQRDMLRQRLADAGLPLPLDDERLVKEIALFADRSDTTEEQTRAESHIAQFRTYMDSGEPVGRSLDFLSQELFREFNTMGSKANHAQLAQLVVRAKTELEKIREQVQNVE
ncbi:MAG: YicC/YloC family endoribonuclease, partial [Roseimicrobium sp.]